MVDGTPVLIFDGDCAFCSSSVRFIERRIRKHPECRPWQHLDLSEFGLAQQECERAVQYVDAQGNVHEAQDAIAELLIDAGRGWSMCGRLMSLPGVRRLAGVSYRLIARNRHRLPGGTPRCVVPAQQRSGNDVSSQKSTASRDDR